MIYVHKEILQGLATENPQGHKLPENEQNHLEDSALLYNNAEQQEEGYAELESPLVSQLCMSPKTSTPCKTSRGPHWAKKWDPTEHSANSFKSKAHVEF